VIISISYHAGKERRGLKLYKKGEKVEVKYDLGGKGILLQGSSPFEEEQKKENQKEEEKKRGLKRRRLP